jgi:hypothetical protein
MDPKIITLLLTPQVMTGSMQSEPQFCFRLFMKIRHLLNTVKQSSLMPNLGPGMSYRGLSCWLLASERGGRGSSEIYSGQSDVAVGFS